jgi:hypothetical protein
MLCAPLRALAKLNRPIAEQMPALILCDRPAATTGPAIDERDGLDGWWYLYSSGLECLAGNLNRLGLWRAPVRPHIALGASAENMTRDHALRHAKQAGYP